MRFILALLSAFAVNTAALANSVTVSRPISTAHVLVADDLVLMGQTLPGTYVDPSNIIGLEARVNLYPGRPVRLGDIGPPASISRNEIVRMLYRRNGLKIITEGRALDRAAVGETISVMNLSSRATVQALVLKAGQVEVAP